MKSLFCLLLTPMICYQCASPIHRVALDLTSLDVTVCLAKGGHGESFGSMVKRLKPVAAITGDFYNPMTLKSVGDIVVDGKILYDGCIGPALVISKNGSPPKIVSQAEYCKIPKFTLKLGMQTGPTLVRHGKIALNVTAEGFHISKYACRTAIGLTADNKLVMVATNVSITLERLADIMLKFDCTDAVVLDGGSSTGIYYDGKVRVRPVRIMVSILAVFPKSPYLHSP